MNKQNFLTRMLLLFALIVGSVNGVWADETYIKVTSASDLSVGETYIFVAKSGDDFYLATGEYSKRLTAVKVGFSVSVDESVVTVSSASAFEVELGGSEGAYTLKMADNKYLGKGASNTEFASNASTSSSINQYTWNYNSTDNALFSNYNDPGNKGKNHTDRYIGLNASTPAIGPYNDEKTYPQVVLYKKGTIVNTDPTITFSNGSVRVGKTLDLSTLFTSNSSGAVTYSITEGGSYATIDGSELTGVAVGNVTVKAAQTADGAYNAGEKTATITVNAALTLSSIAITTAPTKTTYTEGETFDATGMVVTATYSDASTDNVTAFCSFSPSAALTTSDTEITVNYTENEITKTAIQTIVVNEIVDYATLPFVWDGGKSAAFKALTGVSTSTLDSDYADANAPYYIKFNGTGKYIDIKTDCQPGQVAIGIKKVGGANTSTLTIQESADGENFTDVEELYTTGASDAVVNLNTTNKFDEASRYVRIYFTKEYNNTKGSNIGVGPIKITKTEPIEVTSAGYATYVSDADLDYSRLAVKAYKASVSGTGITFTKVTTVPAGEGVLLQGAADTYNVPVAASAVAAWADSENAFIRGTGAAVDSGSGPYNYILNNGANGVGFYKANGKTVAKNRAYLQSTSNEARLSFSFDDEAGEATGINEVKNVKADAAIYNLNGVRVKNMTKGLYIMNGKKVVLK